MIDPKSLRLGNYIECAGFIAPVTSIQEGSISAGKPINNSEVRNVEWVGMVTPELANYVSLTEETLLLFGFEKYGPKGIYFLGEFDCHQTEKILIFRGVAWEVPFVHQLQNLYFTLSGKELELREDPANGLTGKWNFGIMTKDKPQ